MAKINIALSGYNALTDTNPDHFSLKADEDNLLIKEFDRGTVNVATTQTITHNLGYVPFFLAYSRQYGGSDYGPVDHNSFDIAYYAHMDSNDLTLGNVTGSTEPFTYYIFYDEITSGSPSFTEEGSIVKVANSGSNALTSTNPNDFIFHSNLNTLKIIKEGTATISAGAFGYNSFNHGAGISNPHAFMGFVQFPDGSISRLSKLTNISKDGNYGVGEATITSTQFTAFFVGAGTYKIKYYIFETPLVGSTGKSITLSDHKFRVAKSGYNALTETDSNKYNFLSGFNTLKYFDSGSTSLTISGDGTIKTEETSIYHGLGYTPFFACYVNDLGESYYNSIPMNRNAAFFTAWASTYCDNNYLYFKFQYGDLSSYTQNFYYKIFDNDLGF
ncbi:MAG: hypothetical protein BWY19_00910 [bacterium ADurb.Bin212]|nr:MAG: hypothetical protein BWY19_00910 [bacterium ADurb.Bin212]